METLVMASPAWCKLSCFMKKRLTPQAIEGLEK